MPRQRSSSIRWRFVLKKLATKPEPVRQCIPVNTVSKAVILPKSRIFWNVRAMPISTVLCGLMPTTDIPSNTISPELTGNTPVIKLKSVVLPAPFGPITPNTSPCLTPKDMPVRAATPPKLLLTSFNSNSIQFPSYPCLSCCLRLYASKRSVNTCVSGMYGAFLKPNLRLILSTIDSVKIPSGRTAIKMTNNAP